MQILVSQIINSICRGLFNIEIKIPNMAQLSLVNIGKGR
jgi:hypothetical protein